MDNSYFARLPKELRLIIYEYALSIDFSVHISWSQDRRYPTAKLEIALYPDPGPDSKQDSDVDSEVNQDPDPNSDSNEDSDTDSDVGAICPVYDSDSDESLDEDDNVEDRQPTNPLALTSTCRQIRLEALPLFYSVNSLSITSDARIHAEFPTLQAVLLRNWIRRQGDGKAGTYRRVTIAVRCMDENVHASFDLAQDIYDRFSELACCFNPQTTRVSLDLGSYLTPRGSAMPGGSMKWQAVDRVFTMTPWTSLREQVDVCVGIVEGGFKAAKADQGTSQWEHVARLEPLARRSCQALRRLVELVDADERGQPLAGRTWSG